MNWKLLLACVVVAVCGCEQKYQDVALARNQNPPLARYADVHDCHPRDTQDPATSTTPTHPSQRYAECQRSWLSSNVWRRVKASVRSEVSLFSSSDWTAVGVGLIYIGLFGTGVVIDMRARRKSRGGSEWN